MGYKLTKNGEVAETISDDARDHLLAHGWTLVGADVVALDEPPADLGELADEIAETPKAKKGK